MQSELNILEADGVVSSCALEVLGHESISLRFSDSTYTAFELHGEDGFDVLCQLRQLLESDGRLLVCNGSRRDVYPSGMCRDMGWGMKAYVLRIGQTTCDADLVDIYEPCDVERAVRVEQQLEYLEEWRRSIMEGGSF